MPKNVQTTTQSYSLHASKVMLKTLQARFQQYMNQELPDVQAGFLRSKGTRGQIANNHWIMGKVKSSRETSTFASLTTLKLLTVWVKTNWKILKEMSTGPPYLSPEKPVCRSRTIVRTGRGTTDWFQIGKGVR